MPKSRMEGWSPDNILDQRQKAENSLGYTWTEKESMVMAVWDACSTSQDKRWTYHLLSGIPSKIYQNNCVKGETCETADTQDPLN